MTRGLHAVRPSTAFAIAAAALLAVTLAGCGGPANSAPTAQTEGQTFVAGDGSIVVLDPSERQPAPDISGSLLGGGTYALRDHLGEVQVLNVWASWCAPCRAEAPDLASLSAQFADQGVQFVGLNTRDSKVSAERFVSRFGISYPNIIDRDGVLQLAFADSLPPQAIPSTLVIDAQGRVAARILGSASPASLRGVIEQVRAEPST